MDIVRISSKRAGTLFAAGLLLFATMLPALASAATVTSRSIALTSSVIDATNVTYDVTFTAQTDSTDSVVLDFCTTAAVATACTAPTGFDTTVGIGTNDGDTVTQVDANTVQIDLASAADATDVVNFDLTGITNPDTDGVFYARIVTYDNSTHAAGYTSADPDVVGTHFDDGSVALTATDGFDVSGAVLETLTFCAAGADEITSGCGGVVTPPDLVLGTGGVLDTTLDTGTIYTQISTNASGGAVVSLKSDEDTCGGLVRDGAADNEAGCGITPITTPGTISDNASQFGMIITGLGGSTGTTALSGSYHGTNYFMNYVVGDASGVTGPYGDPIFRTTTDGSTAGPISDGTADLTFGANISGTTPAGVYRANLNLIATGTF